MRKNVKKTVLKEVADISKRVAYHGGGLPTWFGFFEPEMPEKLRKLQRKNKK